jgi:hypothetical protein
MATQKLIRSLGELLARGKSVRIAASYTDEGLQNMETTVRSKGLVPCNGRGRCAGSNCVERAVFVVDPRVEPDEGAGWRHGAAKICLTWLIDPANGQPILESAANREPTGEVAPVPVRRSRQPKAAPAESVQVEVGAVSWDALARSYQHKEYGLLARQARALKCENDTLVRQLAEVQARLIRQLDGVAGPTQETVITLDTVLTEPVSETPVSVETTPEPVAEATAETARLR